LLRQPCSAHHSIAEGSQWASYQGVAAPFAASLPVELTAVCQVGIVNGPLASAVFQGVLEDGSVQLAVHDWMAAADDGSELQVAVPHQSDSRNWRTSSPALLGICNLRNDVVELLRVQSKSRVPLGR
jgi:hypothetical protein